MRDYSKKIDKSAPQTFEKTDFKTREIWLSQKIEDVQNTQGKHGCQTYF